MTEIFTLLVCRKRIIAFIVSPAQKIQKSFYVFLMYKLTYFGSIGHRFEILLRITCPSTEKFAEVKRSVFHINQSRNELVQIVCKYLQFGKCGIRIWITKMVFIPISLLPLLHYIVPSINFFLLEFIKQIERSTGKT